MLLGLEDIATKLTSLLDQDTGGPAKPDDDPHAAVAAILREGAREGVDQGAELFFIRRAESKTDPWSGHIAFPGGRREAEDATLLATAIRETQEEVGIDLSHAQLLGRLPDMRAFIRSKRGSLVVAPFVFAVREPVIAVPNVAEVAGTLWVALERLVRGEGRGTYSFTLENKPYDFPCVRLEPDQHVLWGMTHRMMETMVEMLA